MATLVSVNVGLPKDVKRPVKASSRSVILPRIRPRANCASLLGSRSPAINAASMSRPETPKMSEATHLRPCSLPAGSEPVAREVRLPDRILLQMPADDVFGVRRRSDQTVADLRVIGEHKLLAGEHLRPGGPRSDRARAA